MMFNETQSTILKIINENSEITQKKIAVEMELTERAIKKSMVTLTKNGVIKRKGSNRKGRWIVLK